MGSQELVSKYESATEGQRKQVDAILNDDSPRVAEGYIDQHIPGGVNSPAGEDMDSYLRGTPNATSGATYSGPPDGGYGRPAMSAAEEPDKTSGK